MIRTKKHQKKLLNPNFRSIECIRLSLTQFSIVTDGYPCKEKEDSETTPYNSVG